MIRRRTHRSPILPRCFRRNVTHLASVPTAVVALLFLLAPHARATLVGGEVVPAEPSTCDSASLIVAGTLPDDCHTVLGMRVGAPEPLPTMGPIPTYGIRVRVIAEEQNPLLGRPCVLAIQPYKESAPLGRLPFGNYWVDAVEYLYPFPADSSAPKDSSRFTFSFHVSPDTCAVADGCVLLGFGATGYDIPRLDGCTTRTAPGGRACFDVTLVNPMPVGALQTEIEVLEPSGGPAGAERLEPVSVIATPRAAGFQAAWSAVGSTAKIVLYSAGGAAIPTGRGAVLHVCYAVKDGAPEGAYPLHFSRSLVATPGGKSIPFCPTFAAIEGRICVGEPPCDLNGDGVGDIRDIVLLVRCILGGGSGADACTDDARAGADCNGDGSVDVRDVVCCVQRILAHDGGWGPEPPPKGAPAGAPTRLGFDGAAEWVNPLQARAAMIVEPGDAFGGMQWVLDPGAAARVRGLELEDPQGPYALDVSTQPDGSLRVMLYDRGAAGSGSSGAARSALVVPVRLVATLEPAPGVGGPATISIRSVRGAAWDASPLPTVLSNPVASLPASPAAGAPTVLPARPNPFLSETEIAYSIPAEGTVSLRLFDVSGRLVRALVSGRAEAGVHRVRWDGRDGAGRTVGAGVYFVRFEAAGTARTNRLLRLR